MIHKKKSSLGVPVRTSSDRNGEENMKKKIIAALAAMLCLTLAGCQGGTSSPEQSTVNSAGNADITSKAAALCEAVDFTVGDKVVEKSRVTDLLILGVDENDVSEFSAYKVGSGAAPDEFGIFTAKDADAAKRVEDALNKHKDQLYKSFITDGYTPGEAHKFDDSFVETNGTVVFYAICADNSKARELLE